MAIAKMGKNRARDDNLPPTNTKKPGGNAVNSPTRAKMNAVDSSIKNSLNFKLLLYQKRVIIFKNFSLMIAKIGF
ncbi:hypothetical protein JT102_01125 [Helicobacter pylori]|nr:hypothetical protein [Helicobacter pylori]